MVAKRNNRGQPSSPWIHRATGSRRRRPTQQAMGNGIPRKRSGSRKTCWQGPRGSIQRSTPKWCAAAAIWTRGSIRFHLWLQRACSSTKWLQRWKVFENFVRDQMAATAQGQLNKSTYESLAGSMVPRQEDVKVPRRGLVKALTEEAKSGEKKKKRDEMTTQLRSTCAMISKVTALEKTKWRPA